MMQTPMRMISSPTGRIKMSEWISVEDRLPENYAYVLTYDVETTRHEVAFYHEGHWSLDIEGPAGIGV